MQKKDVYLSSLAICIKDPSLIFTFEESTHAFRKLLEYSRSVTSHQDAATLWRNVSTRGHGLANQGQTWGQIWGLNWVWRLYGFNEKVLCLTIKSEFRRFRFSLNRLNLCTGHCELIRRWLLNCLKLFLLISKYETRRVWAPIVF